MIITDNHMHIYKHLGLKALEEFKSAGGTHVFLVSLLSHHYDVHPKSGHDFKKVFESHLNLVKKANKIVKTYAVLSVHPAEITVLGQRVGYNKAAEIMKEAIDLAGELVAKGEAVAIKSGRPHYKVDAFAWKMSKEVMLHAFKIAREINCAVQLHTESFRLEGMIEIAEMADKVGLKRDKIIKHFAPPKIREFEEIGIFPSVIAGNDNVLTAIKQGTRFVLETDYIDDPKRPGAVLGPKTIPKKVKELLEHGFGEDLIYKICAENIEKIYGIEL
ncbi:MAG: TatD family hydrolase [Archaeoglobaceae archaeon]|nr:TatD family hydrolase [Archaeoglobaceae archaeon]MDW7989568.1 TatD family hydrolase [Archaeoglobaceae archaeon]